MDLNKNYYEVLNLAKDCTSEQIKKSYYKLSMKHHPDKGGDPAIFNQINEAYEVLYDAEKRDSWDKKSKFGANYNELYELLNYEFDNMAKAWKEDAFDSFVKNDVLNIVIRIEKDFDGALDYERWVLCKTCDGSGKDSTLKIAIKDERGRVIRTFEAEDGCDFCEGTGLDWRGEKCSFCFGQGKVGTQDCQQCKGEKRILVKNKLKNIKFEDGQESIKLESLGNHSKDIPGKKGHLYILNHKSD